MHHYSLDMDVLEKKLRFTIEKGMNLYKQTKEKIKITVTIEFQYEPLIITMQDFTWTASNHNNVNVISVGCFVNTKTLLVASLCSY